MGSLFLLHGLEETPGRRLNLLSPYLYRLGSSMAARWTKAVTLMRHAPSWFHDEEDHGRRCFQFRVLQSGGVQRQALRILRGRQGADKCLDFMSLVIVVQI